MGRRPALTPPRRTRLRANARFMAALGSLMLLAGGCMTDFDSSDTAQIPGPNPGRELPANALNPMGPVARAQHDLWEVALPIAFIIGALVLFGLLFIVVRFRDKGQQELPKQTHGNTLLEITWTLIPAFILVIIAVPTVRTIFELAEEPGEDALLITAIGKQYWWQFEYTNIGASPDETLFTASELHIPIDRDVYITLDGTGQTEADTGVLHSFWVPSLAGKRDYVPGAARALRIQADDPGVYPGLCAEFCGLSHANMRFTVIAHTEADYEQWLAGSLEPATVPTDPVAVEGAEIFAANCTSCHQVRGLSDVVPPPEGLDDYPAIRTGPDLTHFSQREAFAGYIYDSPFGDQVENTAEAREKLREWIENPQAVKPGAQMTPFGQTLTADQIDALLVYLETLE